MFLSKFVASIPLLPVLYQWLLLLLEWIRWALNCYFRIDISFLQISPQKSQRQDYNRERKNSVQSPSTSQQPSSKLLINEKILHDRLLEIENSAKCSETTNLRVAVGFGSCKDQFVRAVDFFHHFGIDHDNAKLTHYNHIDSRAQLEEMFLFYFTKGVAAERFVSNKQLFKLIAQTVDQNRLPVKEALGGNAPVMASRFAKDGCRVFLGSIIGQSLQNVSNINRKITVLNEDQDCGDVHILLEYDVRDRIGSHAPPRANRFIVHSDSSNPFISTMERFFDAMVAYRPHVIVIGALQMLDNFPFRDAEMEQRLQLLGCHLQAEHLRNVPVHFELASFTDPKLMRLLVEHVVLSADSLGMNEQELANLYSFLAEQKITLAEDAYVSLDVELDKIRFIFKHLEKQKSRIRQLTRLHLHTILFQVIAVRRPKKNDCEGIWQNNEVAVARSSLMATRHASQSETIDLSKVRLLFRGPITLPQTGEQIELTADRPVASWSESLELDIFSDDDEDGVDDTIELDFYVTPVLISTDVKQTTGGGDNISPVGLVSQLNHLAQ